MNRITFAVLITFVMGLCSQALIDNPLDLSPAPIQNTDQTGLYDTGTPSYADIWVDPVNGNDANPGTLAAPFRTLTHAWETIPAGDPLTQAVRINLQPGTYTGEMMPGYWENRHGTLSAPVLIRGNGAGPAQVVLQETVNIYNVEYLYFENLSIIFGGDVFHCELCGHVLLRNMVLDGGAQQAQETIKVNQSQYFYVENSDVSGAWNVAIDFVAVEYGHVIGNHVHNAGDWCIYFKGGSAYLTVESNIIYDCGTGGVSAGQGTGFQYMVSPWIQYEAYDVKVVNNIIHDIEGAGLGVNGGFNILMAYNTMYRIGSRDHIFESAFGARSCDGPPEEPSRGRCQQYLDQGGWGTTVISDGENYVRIPSKNVFIYNNVFYNPAGYASQWMHFAIYDPHANPPQSNAPNPAVTDDNLQIRGNVIWNGDASMPLGIEGSQACQPANTACNETQLLADNSINTVEPYFVNPGSGDFHPTGSWLSSVTTYPIPDFAWGLAGVPTGNNSNTVALDFENVARKTNSPPGAYSVAPSFSLRFYGHGTGQIDRVKIKIDAPEVPADIGQDFTIEFWMKASQSDNTSGSCVSGGDAWVNGNIMLDRDIFGAGDYGDFGVSLYGGRIAFGAANGSFGQTLCSTASVADNNWHHIALTRNQSSGQMNIFVDGQLNVSGTGPAGDLRYRNGRATSYPNSDPYLVFGAEKHDYDPLNYPSYSGYLDEVRLSNVIRYAGAFSPSPLPFNADANTVGLYHFDEGPVGSCAGSILDSSAGGSSSGVCLFGGSGTAGPVYSTEIPFTASPFSDVPLGYWSYSYIKRLYNAGITGGCTTTPLNYCPGNSVTRAQMAIFLLRGMHGSAYTPPAATGTMFTDVSAGSFAAAWIEQLANEGITSGCGGGNFCPNSVVTRAQMAIFLVRAKHGIAFVPPAATGIFPDVPAASFGASYIEQLVTDGITSGCGGGLYCPSATVKRDSMAVFLVKNFNLP